MQRNFMPAIKLALVGLVVAGFVAPISASGGNAPNSSPLVSPRRSGGGISEIHAQRIAAGQAEVRQSQTQYGGR
jgi:hypothetical protein